MLSSGPASQGLMEAEIRASALGPRLRPNGRLGPGTTRYTWEGAFEGLAPALREAVIVFCRHVAPATWAVTSPEEALDAAAAGLEGAEGALGVQVWGGHGGAAGDLRRTLITRLAAIGGTFRPNDPDRVLSVFLGEAGIVLGVSRPSENRSPYPGGAFRLQAREGPSRSGRKLEEAFATFDLHLPGRDVLDVGAAPGGWTTELLRRGLRVTAVDRAPIHLPPLPALTVLTGDFRRLDVGGPFDGVFADANGPFEEVGRGLLDLTRRLRPGAVLLWTVKFGRKHPLRVLKDARRLLTKVYRLLDGRQLFHNRDEATLVFRREDRGGPE